MAGTGPDNGRSRAAADRAGRGRQAARGLHEPAYLHIANSIAEQIGAGHYRPGDQLPTEPRLRAEFGVSPATIRRAVSILLDRGLVSTTQGKGTFVRSLDIGEAVFRLQEITEMWTGGGGDVDVLLLEARIQPAGGQASFMLLREPGDPLVFMRRLIKRGGVPLIYQVEHVVYDERRPLVETQLQITSLDGLLLAGRAEGISSGRLTIQAVSLDAEAARHLAVPPGSPAFCLEHLFLDFDGRPVSWGTFLCRADQFRLTTHIGVSPAPTEKEL